MKHFFVLIAALLTTSFCMAQNTSSQALNYCVTYTKDHLFLQKDSGFNVVDYDIEWPEVVDFSKAMPLRQLIAESFTGTPYSTLDSTLTSINEMYGMPVTGQFKTIPDDNRFCYVTSKARIVGYSRGHWIAYLLENTVEPQKLSEFKQRKAFRVVVYDISRDKLLLADDLVSSALVNRLEPQDFYDNLYSPLSDDFYDNMVSCQILGVWMDGNDLCFLVNAKTDDDAAMYTARMPLADYSYVLSREGRRVFTKDAKPVKPVPIMTSQTWHGDSIYNNVEKMPVFKGGQDGLKQYMSHAPKTAVSLGKPTRLLASFIVDKDGNVRDVCVLNPVHPEIDRHAAALISGMPTFTPGEHNGKKVCVRIYMPFSYR